MPKQYAIIQNWLMEIFVNNLFDKLAILKLLVHTICKVYHQWSCSVFSSGGLTGIRRVYHNTSLWAYTIQLVIIKLQTKYQIIPINTRQENFDRKLILTDWRTDGGYTIIRPFGRVKMTRMFIFNKLMMHPICHKSIKRSFWTSGIGPCALLYSGREPNRK